METFELITAIVIVVCIGACIFFFRERPKLSGKLGVLTIVLGSVSFAVWTIKFALTKEGIERFVLIASGLIIAVIVATYWLRFWQRKRPDRSTNLAP